MTRLLKPIIGLLVFAVLLVVQPVSGQSTPDAVDRLKAKYETIESLVASFSYTLHSDLLDEPQHAEGTLVLRGDEYLIETSTHLVRTDGEVTWVLNKSDNQLVISDNDEDETSFSVSEFFFHFDDRFTPAATRSEKVKSADHTVLSLSPRDDDSFLTQVTLFIRDSDDLITRIETNDLNDTLVVYNIDEIKLNQSLEDEDFTIETSEDTDVVDLRY